MFFFQWNTLMVNINDKNNHIACKVFSGSIIPDTRLVLVSNTNRNPSTTRTSKFVNLSAYKLIVSFRDGSRSILEPQLKGPFMEALIIGHRIETDTGSIQVIPGEECEVTNILRRQAYVSAGRHCYWEELIDIDVIRSCRNGVYLKSADAVVGLYDREPKLTEHPFSIQRVHNLYLNLGDDFDSETDINVGIRFIDNDNMHSKLYALFHEQIVVIIPKRSNTLDDGIYITGLNSLISDSSNSIRQDLCYSYDAVLAGNTPVQMYTTLIEAKDALAKKRGNLALEKIEEHAHELAIATIKREKELLENENALLKSQQLKEKVIIEELEVTRLMKLQQQKLEYEERINVYKEESIKLSGKYKIVTETLKVITVIITVSAAFYKLKK